MLGNRVLYNLISKRYAGHSKWANIKHIKATKDAQRSALFTKLSRQMKVAIQEGGSPNPDANLRLAQVIDQAKRHSMPVTTIQNVIKSSQANKDNCKPGLLEIKGPAGCIILCQVFTDNLTRCKQGIATILRKHKNLIVHERLIKPNRLIANSFYISALYDAVLFSNSSFSDGGGRHLFDQKGVIEAVLDSNKNEEEILEAAMEHAIESGAEDVKISSDNTIQFFCEPKHLKTVHTHLQDLKYNIISCDVEFIPKLCIPVDGNHLENLSVMFDKLESHEEVVKLYDNIG